MLLHQEAGIEAAIVPQNINGVAVDGDWMNLEDYEHLSIILQQGAWAAGTPAVTLEQATDVAGTGAKALAFATRWEKEALVDPSFTETAVTANTFNLPATANTMNVLEIPAQSLDRVNNFNCVRVRVATPGANDDYLGISYILGKPRYSQAVVPDPKVD